MKHKTRMQVEKELQALIGEFDLSDRLSVARIKKIIFNSNGEQLTDTMNEYYKKCFQYFPEQNDFEEMNRILQVLVDAWNYFPHKSLGGKSPKDMVLKLEKMQSRKDKNTKSTSVQKVVVGGVEMTLEEHQSMIREMEQAQKPFKAWIDEVVLPKYTNFLIQTVREKNKREKDFQVADIFFSRVLYVGFVRFDLIRTEFIQKEFPIWWQSHVLDSRITPSQVRASLKRLFSFIDLVFDIPANEFGF